MNSLSRKRILLGISGGIAAYKSAELVRRLSEYGADVQVVMTAAATEFVTPLTFQALSGRTVRTDLFDQDAEAAMSHIELARWADVILIAPCSANTFAKIAQGMADNLLTTICLASDAPIALAPAMNRLMWENDATQANLAVLKQHGINIFGPGTGEQACGETGDGRMLEPVELALATAGLFQSQALIGKKVLITAGPTREAIDPVRFLSNRSSGKMGFALAEAACEAGAVVSLISGPVSLSCSDDIERINVETAEQMHSAAMRLAPQTDIFIACAAVSDYRLANPAPEKIKKQAETLELKLLKNPDILAEIAALPKSPFCVGFAAETQNLLENAVQKLKQKNLDMIIANSVGENSGFNQDENAVEIIWRDGHQSIQKMHKSKLARRLIQQIEQQFKPLSTNKISLKSTVS